MSFCSIGFPHVHIVAKLKGVPTLDKNTEAECAAWIDAHIAAAIPSDLEKDDPYFVAIKTHMMHKCAVAENGCKSCSEAICRRGYDSNPIQDGTTFNDRGFPIYKRPTPAGNTENNLIVFLMFYLYLFSYTYFMSYRFKSCSSQ